MTLAPWLGMAATSFAAGLLLASNGFGFAVLAVPFFLLFAPADQAIQVTIILSVAISFAVLPGVRRGIDPPLLARLTLGSLAGLPAGLAAFAYAEPRLVRAVAGTVIAVLAAVQALSRYRRHQPMLALTAAGDLAAGAVAGAATGLVGMPGPPLVIYLIMAGAPAQKSRATQIAFFALIYTVTLAANVAFAGVSGAGWLLAASLMPTTAIGALVGTHIGNRLDENTAATLAIVVLGIAGVYTLAAALW